MESNIDKESNAPSSFSAMLKIVEYSDSENSVLLTKISSSVGHYGAVPLSPQNAHYDIQDTLYKKVSYSKSETDDEMEGVKSLVEIFLDKSEEEKYETENKSETEEKSEADNKSDMDDTSADSEWESVKVMKTDAYESESQIYTLVESDTESHSETDVEK